MKNTVFGLILLGTIIGCSTSRNLPINERISSFQVSECQTNCGSDSTGIRQNKIVKGDLHIKLGHIVNCSWKYGYVTNILQRNDSLYIELDRPHETNTITKNDSIVIIEEIYPLADCDCFFYFDMIIEDVLNPPLTIRIHERLDKNNFWDRKNKIEIVEIEEVKEIKNK